MDFNSRRFEQRLKVLLKIYLIFRTFSACIVREAMTLIEKLFKF
jgi:hypothetical protein